MPIEKDAWLLHVLLHGAGSVGGSSDADCMRELYLLDDSTSETAWQDHARCATVDPEVMMNGPVEAAEEVCRWCAVSDECGAYAEANDEQFGVWGGELRGAR